MQPKDVQFRVCYCSGNVLHCILGKRDIEGMEFITVHTDIFLTKTQVQSDVISQIDIKEEVNEKYANVFKDQGTLASFTWKSRTVCDLYSYRQGKYR